MQPSGVLARHTHVYAWIIRAVGLAAPALLLSGCGGSRSPSRSDSAPDANHEEVGDPAVWSVTPGAALDADSTTFTALVSRLGCSGGETGDVLSPEIREIERRVIITFQVASLPEGAHTCPGNKQVAYDIDLNESLGDRALIDGECLDGAAAAETSFCNPDGVRQDAVEDGATKLDPQAARTISAR